MNTDDDDFKITISAPDGTGLMFPENSYTFDNTYTLDSSSVTTVTSGTTVGGVTYNTDWQDGLDIRTTFDIDDNWPTESRILDMIKEYPALKLQYVRVLEVYNLVKGDFDHGKDILE